MKDQKKEIASKLRDLADQIEQESSPVLACAALVVTRAPGDRTGVHWISEPGDYGPSRLSAAVEGFASWVERGVEPDKTSS